MNTSYDCANKYKDDILAILLLLFCYMGSFSLKQKISKEKKTDLNSIENWDQFGLVRKISVEQLRSCDGFNEVPDKQASEIIESLYQLSILSFNIYKNEKCFLVIEEESNVK
ncbi:MAG: hypothetical protein K0R26_1941 [Bacteroidota bacterium]|jgi:hypothetical protein|nr:hypothetical protein [Bacteroidota bacterium]